MNHWEALNYRRRLCCRMTRRRRTRTRTDRGADNVHRTISSSHHHEHHGHMTAASVTLVQCMCMCVMFTLGIHVYLSFITRHTYIVTFVLDYCSLLLLCWYDFRYFDIQYRCTSVYIHIYRYIAYT